MERDTSRRLINLSRGRSARRVEKEARVRPRGSAVALSKAGARDRSVIGKSSGDYEAWKPSRQARGALRARGDSFRSVDEGVDGVVVTVPFSGKSGRSTIVTSRRREEIPSEEARTDGRE